jgi:hypothetical protein
VDQPMQKQRVYESYFRSPYLIWQASLTHNGFGEVSGPLDHFSRGGGDLKYSGEYKNLAQRDKFIPNFNFQLNY